MIRGQLQFVPARIAAGVTLVVVSAALALTESGCGGASADDGAFGAPPDLVVGELGIGPAQFKFPRCVTIDPRSGRFWVVDRTGRIQLFTPDGELITSWETPEHEFGQPVGLAVDRDGTLLVSDSHYHRVLRYRPDGSEILARWGSKGTGPGQITFGRDVAVDAAGNVYVGDYGGMNDRVQKFSPAGEFLLEWGRQGTGDGEFDRVQGMTIDPGTGRGDRETVLVADCCNHRVQRFDTAGRFLGTFGTLGTAPGELRYPSSVAVLADGSILVSEWGNNRVQKFDANGRSIGTWGRPGRSIGELATPWDVEVAPTKGGERIFVVDYGNHRLQVFDAAGAFRAVEREVTSRDVVDPSGAIASVRSLVCE